VSIGPSTGAVLKDEGRGWTVRFLALSEPKETSVLVGTDKRVTKPEKVKNGIVVQVGKVLPNTKITISLGSKPELSHNDVETFTRPILEDAQIQYGLKEDVWQILAAKVSSTLKVSRLLALEIDENLRDAVLEYLLAE
jgi:predicted RecA/RadA family phage recombinase